MTSGCFCIDFIVPSLESVHGLSVEQQQARFFSSAGSPCQRCSWSPPIYQSCEPAPACLCRCARAAVSKKLNIFQLQLLSEVQTEPGSWTCTSSAAPQFITSLCHNWVQILTLAGNLCSNGTDQQLFIPPKLMIRTFVPCSFHLAEKWHWHFQEEARYQMKTL